MLMVLRTALFWVLSQRVVEISCRHFGTTYRSHLLRSSIQKKSRLSENGVYIGKSVWENIYMSRVEERKRKESAIYYYKQINPKQKIGGGGKVVAQSCSTMCRAGRHQNPIVG